MNVNPRTQETAMLTAVLIAAFVVAVGLAVYGLPAWMVAGTITSLGDLFAALMDAVSNQ